MKKEYLNILTTMENMTDNELESFTAGFVIGIKIGDRLDKQEKNEESPKPRYPSNAYRLYKEKKLIPIERAKEILKRAVEAYEFELEQQEYETEEDRHDVVLNKFGMTQDEYETITGRKL